VNIAMNKNKMQELKDEQDRDLRRLNRENMVEGNDAD